MIVSYPTSGRKTLPAGTTKVNIKSRQVILPDNTKEDIYMSKPIEIFKCILININEQVDIKYYLKGNPVFIGTQFPTLDRVNLEFDEIEITTTLSTVQVVLQMSDEVDGVPNLTTRADYASDVTGVSQGRKTVAISGTAEPLSAVSISCKGVLVTAMTNNTSIVVVGGAGVIAALATREGTPLFPGDHDPENVTDLNQVYLDALVAGEGVTYKYYF